MSRTAVKASAVGALAVGIALAIAFAPGHRGWFDVGVYYGTVHYWLDSGGDVYDYLRPGTVYGFTYPPFAVLSMLPMELVSWHTAVALSLVLITAAVLMARRYRAAAVAAGTTAGATLLAALVMPGASRVFWTEALWDTGRIGSLGYVSNQSLNGLLARLDPTAGGGLIWALTVLVVLVIWGYRVRQAGDETSAGIMVWAGADVPHLLVPAVAPHGPTRVRPQVPRSEAAPAAFTSRTQGSEGRVHR